MTHEALQSEPLSPEDALGHVLYHCGIDTVEFYPLSISLPMKMKREELVRYVAAAQYYAVTQEDEYYCMSINGLSENNFHISPTFTGNDNNRYTLKDVSIWKTGVFVGVAIQSKNINLESVILTPAQLLSLMS